MADLDLHLAPGGQISSWSGSDSARCGLLLTRLLDRKRLGPATEVFRHIHGAQDFIQGKTGVSRAPSGRSLYPADGAGRAIGLCLSHPGAGPCCSSPPGRGGKVPEIASAALQWAPGHSNSCGGSRTRRSCWRPMTSTTRANHFLSPSCSRLLSVASWRRGLPSSSREPGRDDYPQREDGRGSHRPRIPEISESSQANAQPRLYRL